jgi:hypothetical protein
MDPNEMIKAQQEWVKNHNSKETPEQKADRIGVPLLPRRPPIPITGYNPTIAICGECGHEVKSGPDYFSCPLQNCPLGGRTTLN